MNSNQTGRMPKQRAISAKSTQCDPGEFIPNRRAADFYTASASVLRVLGRVTRRAAATHSNTMILKSGARRVTISEAQGPSLDGGEWYPNPTQRNTKTNKLKAGQSTPWPT